MKKLIAYLMTLLILLPFPAMAQQQQASSNQLTQTMPAQMSEIEQHGVSLRPIMVAPTNGLETNIPETLRTLNYATVLDNLLMTKHGIWSDANAGYVNWISNLNSGAVVNDCAFCSGTTSGSLIPLLFLQAYNGSGSGKLYKYEPVGGVLTDVTPAGITFNGPGSLCPCFRQDVAGSVILTAYNDEPWASVGAATFTRFGTWPASIGGTSYANPSFSENFQTRQIFAGMQAHPSTVIISAFNTTGVWTVSSPQQATDAGAITLPYSFGPITGLKVFRLGNSNQDTVCVIGCQRAICMLTGTDATNFGISVLSTGYGVMDNRTWVDLGSDLFFLATDGIRHINNSTLGQSLVTSQPAFAINDLQMALSYDPTSYTTNAGLAFAVSHPLSQEVQFWVVKSGDTYPSHCIVMNYSNGDLNNPIWSTRSGFSATCGATSPRDGTMFLGDNTGHLQKHYDGNTFNGSAINWTYQTPFISGDNILQNASMRKCVVACEGPAQNFNIAAYTMTQHVDGTTRRNLQATKTLNDSSQTYTDLSTWASGNTTTYTKYLDFSPPGSGRNWFLRVTGTSTSQHISLIGILAILTLGGWKQ